MRSRGEGAALRLTLKRWSPARFELIASDLTGRALWRLAVENDRGRLEGGSRGRRCRFDPAAAIDLPELHLPLEAETLPSLLLGQLPAGRVVASDTGVDSVRDRHDRIWEIEREAGVLVAWRLMSSQGSPELAWRRDEDRFRLECRERDLVVNWRERARSELRAPAPALELETELPDCRELDLS